MRLSRLNLALSKGLYSKEGKYVQMANGQIILGIDPGTVVMGYGLISTGKLSTGPTAGGGTAAISLVEMGVLQLHRTADHAERLRLIFSTVQRLIQEHKPTSVAIEAPFFGKNVQSMLKLGRAQGVAMAAAMVNGLMPTEYAPRLVKQTVTGRGAATKEQVWDMLRRILHLPDETPSHYDATDAVAVALCHHFQQSPLRAAISAPITKKKSSATSSWEAFAAQNPGRLR